MGLIFHDSLIDYLFSYHIIVLTTSTPFFGEILGPYIFQNDLNHFATMMYVRHSFISKKVVHNYLPFISVENILSCIDIKGIMISYI